MPLGEKGTKTRAEIVERATTLIYHQGYAATSFTDIVAASGLYRGNIYHYFKTKDDILRAVIDGHLAQYRALLQGWSRDRAEPRDRILALVEMLTGREADLVRYGCPVGSLNTELGKGHPELQRSARALFDLFADWLEAACKELGLAARARAVALHLLGRAQGIALLAHVYGDADLLRRESEELARWIRCLGTTDPGPEVTGSG
jgi:AcrR family transcriptional regulator